MTADRKIKFKEQTSALYAALGEYSAKFSELCMTMDGLVSLVLQYHGLRNSAISQLIVCNMSAREILHLLEGLCAELLEERLNRSTTNELFKDIEKAIEKRNEVFHGYHLIGWGNVDTVDYSQAYAVKFKGSKSHGLYKKELPQTVTEYEDLTKELVLLNDRTRSLLRLFWPNQEFPSPPTP